MSDKVPMTASGFARLEEELRYLKSTARPEVIRAIAEAREHGDLSENAEYHAARERQSFIEGRVAELEDKIARAEVIDLDGDTVKFGATVTLVDEDTEAETAYQLVGELEADVKEGRLAITAPLARALSDRRAEIGTKPADPNLGKRGNPDQNDHYMLMNLKLQYYLPVEVFKKWEAKTRGNKARRLEVREARKSKSDTN